MFSIWKCLKCRFTSHDKEEVGLHTRFAHSQKYCPVCVKKHVDMNWEQYKVHVQAAEKKVCTVKDCGSWFYIMSELVSHSNKVHGDKIWACDHDGCKKTFSYKPSLIQHQQTHATDRTKDFKCQIDGCTKAYFNQGALNRHIHGKHRKASTLSPNRVDTRRACTSTQASSNPEELIARLTQENEKQREVIESQRQKIVRLKNQLAQRKRKDPQSSTFSTIPFRKRRDK